MISNATGIISLFVQGVCLAFVGIFAFTGCTSQTPPQKPITRLRIGVLPGENRNDLESQFTPLVDYLERSIRIPCELVLHDSYTDLQVAFEQGEVELAWLGGYTFVNVNQSRNAQPIVSRDRDLRFTSYFLVGGDESATDLQSFRGKRIAFGSQLSTSGHLMPRYFMQENGIVPEEFFGEILYTGAHDKTAMAVRDGIVDIGVASGPAIDAMFSTGKLSTDSIRILKETPPFLDYVWACQQTVPPEIRTSICNAFLNLSMTDPEHEEILANLRAEHFLPVHSDDFDALRSVIANTRSVEVAE